MAETLIPYSDIIFPPAPVDRPYVFTNMVSTLDGKIVSGEPNEDVSDLGSKTDHQAMRNLERAADAVLIGAGTVRATTPRWKPDSPVRIVLTQSGNLPWDARFFEKDDAQVFVASPQPIQAAPAWLQFKNLPNLLKDLRERGIERLLCLGGSELNAQLFREDLVDELFLTLAPKVKLGKTMPTYAGGDPLPRESLLQFNLIQHQAIGDELFLRYRRRTGE